MALRKLKERQKGNEAKFAEICRKFDEEATQIARKTLNTKNSGQVHRYKVMLRESIKDAVNNTDSILAETVSLSNKLTEDLKFANIKYATAMRFFSEGGNFTTDEAKSMLKNLKKLEKNAAKSLALIYKEDKSKHSKFRAKLDTENADKSSSVLELIQEHEHNEKSVQKIQKLQDDIRAEVISLKRGAMNMETPFKDLVEASTKKLGQHDYIETFMHELKEITTKIIDRANYLLHPEPVVMYSSVNDEAQNRTDIAPTSDIKNYTTLLFNFTPGAEEEENEGCFVSKLNHHLYNSLNDIQLRAKSLLLVPAILASFGRRPLWDSYGLGAVFDFNNSAYFLCPARYFDYAKLRNRYG